MHITKIPADPKLRPAGIFLEELYIRILSDITVKYLLYLVEKAFALVVVVFAKACLELAEQILLCLVKVLGDLYIDRNELIASVGAVKTLYALVSQSEYCTRLSALGDSELNLAVDARNCYLAAENCLTVGNGYLCMDIIFVSYEDRIGTNLNCYMKIACGTSVKSAVALTSYLKCLTVVDTCGDSYINCLGH